MIQRVRMKGLEVLVHALQDVLRPAMPIRLLTMDSEQWLHVGDLIRALEPKARRRARKR